MAIPHLRTAAVSPPYQATYTLGGTEAFRLDAASFTITPDPSGDYVIPVLQAATPDGKIIAEIAAPAATIFNASTTQPFDDTAPASFTDDHIVFFPGGVASYSLYDYFGSPVTSQVTFEWPQPPATAAQRSYTWLKSTGAVTLGATIGTATVFKSASVTVTLTAGIASGHYAFLLATFLLPGSAFPDPLPGQTIVTDSKHAGTVDYSLSVPFFPGGLRLQTAAGLYAFTAPIWYRLSSPLSAGDTITLTWPHAIPAWMQLDVSDLAGAQVPGPVGNTAPNGYVDILESATVTPFTSAESPTPIFNRAVIAEGMYVLPSVGTMDVQYGRGLYDTPGTVGNFPFSANIYAQCKLSELHLSPQDTITMFTTDDTFQVRTSDVISKPVLWAIDDAA